MATRGVGRTRNYATIVYPESAPDNWSRILSEACIPCFISPLHDQDVLSDGTGTLKKPHYHVMLMYDSVKTPEQAQEVFSKIGGIGCEKVESIRSYSRYLCHLDDPDKVQYKVDDVLSYGGADYIATIGMVSDKYKAIGEIIDFCEENDIYSYADLIVWCRSNRSDWFRVLCDNGTYVVREYLKSRSWEAKSGK